MAQPQLVVKIIANTAELIANLNAGRGAIEAYGPTVAKMQDTWARNSATIIEKAALVTASMKGIGASTLTAADAAKNLKVLEAGMAQLQQAGQPIPALMKSTADELRAAAAPTLSFAQQMDGLKNNLTSFASGARTAGIGLTAGITAPILAVGAAAIKLGMDAVESENLVTVSFGDMKGSADEWSAGLSKNLGLNRFETEKMAGTLFNMTTSMGLSRDASFKMSTGVVQLAADMASFRNIPMEEALLKIRSGLTGEAEPLKAIGILVNENTVKTFAYTHGIAAQGAELTEQQKVMARYGSIMAQTSNDQGDLARTLESPANQLRIMKSRVEEAATALGVSLMPMVQTVIGGVSSLVPYIQSAVQWFTTLPEPVKLSTVGLLAIAAAVGPVLLLLGTMASGVASLIPLYVTLAGTGTAVAASSATAAAGLATVGAGSAAAAGGVGVLGTAIAAAGSALSLLFLTPVGLAILAAAALAAGVYYLSTALDTTIPPTDRFSWVVSETAAHLDVATAAADQYGDALYNVGEYSGTAAARSRLLASEVKDHAAEMKANGLQMLANDSAVEKLFGSHALLLPAIASAGDAVATYSTQLAAAKSEVADLTSAQLKDIAAGKALGSTTLELSTSLHISEGALKLVEAGAAAATKAITEKAAAVKKAAEDTAKWDESVRAASFSLRKLVLDTNAVAPAIQSMNASMGAYDLIAEHGVDVMLRHGAATKAANVELASMGMLMPNLAIASEGVSAEVDKMATHVKASFGSVFNDLPNVIMAAFTGGGNVGQAIGGSIGAKLFAEDGPLGSLFKKGGDFIGTLAGGGIGKMLGSSLGSMMGPLGTMLGGMAGDLIGPLISKVGGFFKSLFGGISEMEKAGRQTAGDFRTHLASLLSDTQRLEAGNDEWKKSVIAIRDAYMANGFTEAQALDAANRLWLAEKKGGDAAKAVIQEITLNMGSFGAATNIATGAAISGLGAATNAAQVFGANVTAAANSAVSNLGAVASAGAAAGAVISAALASNPSAPRGGSSSEMDAINHFIRGNIHDREARFGDGEVPWDVMYSEGDWRRIPDALGISPARLHELNVPGFAGGTNGLVNFGRSTRVDLHGEEEVRTAAQVRGDRMSTSAMESRLASIERMLRNQPRAFGIAMKEAAAFGGAR